MRQQKAKSLSQIIFHFPLYSYFKIIITVSKDNIDYLSVYPNEEYHINEDIMVKEDNWRIIGDLLDTTKVRKSQAKGVEVIDSRIEHLLTQFDFEFDVVTISELAMKLNVSQVRKRAPWVYKLLELDRSIGPGGYTLIFRRRTFGFGQLLKYDAIYRPMKYVYLPFGLTYCPACWSRDIAENASAHV